MNTYCVRIYFFFTCVAPSLPSLISSKQNVWVESDGPNGPVVQMFLVGTIFPSNCGWMDPMPYPAIWMGCGTHTNTQHKCRSIPRSKHTIREYDFKYTVVQILVVEKNNTKNQDTHIIKIKTNFSVFLLLLHLYQTRL
jgi:hypothetical protein